jgi:hypothetical protein
MTNVEAIFIVFKTPATYTTTNLFYSDVVLFNDTTNFDLHTTSASLNYDASSSPSDTTHLINLTASTFHVLQVNFDAPQTFTAPLTLTPTGFRGSIAEIIVINGPLGTPEKNNIRSYLSTKYP